MTTPNPLRLFTLLFALLLLSTASATAQTDPGDLATFADAEDHIALPDDLIRTVADTLFTLEMWFRAESGDGGVLFGYQNDDRAGSPSEFVPALYVDTNGNLRGQVWNGGSNPITSTATVDDGEWHHLALVVDSLFNSDDHEQRLYLDGELVGTITGEVTHGSMSFNQIGTGYTNAWPNGNGGWFDFMGDIDEVRLWDTARTESDIRAAMHLVGDAADADLLAYYPLDGDANDATANVRHGTNAGADFAASDAPFASGVNAFGAEDTADFSTANLAFADITTSATAHVYELDRSAAVEAGLPADLFEAPKARTVLGTTSWLLRRFDPALTATTADLTFTFSGDIVDDDEAVPGLIKLYGRAWNATPTDDWTLIGSASTANATTDAVTFDAVPTGDDDQFGQFVVIRHPAPDAIAGNALSFNGAGQFAPLAPSLLPNTGTDLTIELWFRTEGNGYGVLFGAQDVSYLGGTPTQYGTLLFVGFDGRLYGGFKGHALMYGDTTVRDGAWHHVALTADGAGQKLYLDGTEVDAQGGAVDQTDLTSSQFGIGYTLGFSQTNNGWFPFQGQIDEARLWAAPRTETQLRERLHQTLTGGEADLRAYWQFNEASGSLTQDIAFSDDDGNLDNVSLTASTVPLGAGEFASASEVASGSVSFGTSDLEFTFTTGDPAAFLTVNRIDTAPNVATLGSLVTPLGPGTQYWVVNRYDSSTPIDVDLTFTVDGDYSALTPGLVKLFTRGSAATGAWRLSAGATTITYDGGSNTSAITFPGLTGFSQFFLGQAPPPDALSGTALAFDGQNDWVNVPDFTVPASFTVEFWAKRDQTGTWDMAVNHGDAVTTNQHLHIGFRQTNQFTFAFFSNDLNTPAYTDTDWHHWAVTYDAATKARTIYRDGIAVASDISPADYAGAGALRFGRYQASPALGYFGGSLEDLRVWQVVRTEEEIRRAAHATLTGVEPGLYAHWQFNDASGTLAADITGGKDGTLTNMVPATNWITSPAPFGTGAVSVQAEVASGVVDFTGTGLAMEFVSGQAGTPLVVHQIANAPNRPLGILFDTFDDQYWVVNRYGTGDFETSVTLTLDPSLLNADDETTPSRIRLFERSSNSVGAWGFAAAASTVDATTGEVVFEGITDFSQLLVGRAPEPDDVAGRMLDFDGTDDYMLIPNTSALQSEQLTVEYWVWVDDVHDPVMASKTSTTTGQDAWRIGLRNTAGIGWRLEFCGWEGTGLSCDYSGVIPSPIGRWVYVAATYDGTNKRGYVNGIQVMHVTDNLSLDTQSADLWVGRMPNGSNAFDGRLDELRIWNKARTLTQLRENMQRTLDGTETGIRGYWQFNEDPFANIAGDVVGADDGVVTGAASVLSDAPILENTTGAITAQATEELGEVDFPGTDLTLTFVAHSLATIRVTKLPMTGTFPNVLPTGSSDVFDDYLWLVNRFSTGPVDAHLTFRLDEDLTPADERTPSNIKLFSRGSFSTGEWTLAAHATEVNAATDEVTFKNLRGFSQFVIARGATPVATASNALDGTATSAFSQNLGNVTAELWVYNDGSAPGTAPVALLDRGDNFAITWSHPGAGVPTADASVVVGGTPYTASFGDLTPDRWAHLALTFDGSTLRAYTNGTLISETAASGAPDIDSAPLTFADAAFPGLVDEVRLWSFARELAEVRGSMHRLLLGNEPGLKGYWRFDELANLGVNSDGADDVEDRSANNNHADLVTGVLAASDVPYVPVLPGTLSASDGTANLPEDRVTLTWTAVSMPSVVYEIERDGDLLSVIDSGTNTYADLEGDPGATFTYCVTAVTPANLRSEPLCDTGARYITAPSDLSATDATSASAVFLAWEDNSFIEFGFYVERDGVRIDTLAANAQFYSDASAEAGVVYTYCVLALDDDGFESTSTCDAGERGFVTMPGDVAATDGTYPSKVLVTWKDLTTDNTGYQIYKRRIAPTVQPDSSLYTSVGPDAEQYEDTSVIEGETYRYCLTTLAAGGYTSETLCDTGGIGILPPAEAVAASDAAYDDRVTITWTDATDTEDGFNVFRRTAGSVTPQRLVGTTKANIVTFDDETAQPGVIYEYCVQAFSNLGGQAVQACDNGERSVVVAPTNVTATDQEHEDRVTLTWESASTVAVLFHVYRNNEQIASLAATQLEVDDLDIASGVNYTYCVTAVTAADDESGQACDVGSRRILPVTTVEATDQGEDGVTYEDHVILTWENQSEVATGLHVYRRAELTALENTLIATLAPSAVSYNDFTGVPGTKYEYTVAAFDDLGESDGTSASASRTLLAPTSVSATDGASETQVIINWVDNSRYETGYRVRIYYPSSTLLSTIDLPERTFAYVHDVAAADLGKAFRYEVVAFDAYGESTSAEDTGFTTVLAPASFNASDTYDGKVILTWVDRSEMETSFTITRGLPGGSTTQILTPAANAVLAEDTGLTNGTTYQYCIVAVGAQASSAAVCDNGTPQIVAPVGVSANVKASDGLYDSRVRVEWAKSNFAGATGFRVKANDRVVFESATNDVETFDHFDAAPGEVALYCVEPIGGSAATLCDMGWRPVDGFIGGQVITISGAGVKDVNVCLSPTPNQALLLDGEDGRVQVQAVEMPTDDLTIEFWARSRDTGVNGSLISYAAAGSHNEILIGAFDGLDIYIQGAATGLNAGQRIRINDDAWHHYAATWTKSTGAVQLYLDGVLQSNYSRTISATTGVAIEQGGTLVLGQDQDSIGGGFDATQAFEGRMDDVRIWSTVRTQAEIAASMNERLTGEEAGLAAYFPLDEGRGGFTANLLRNPQNGALYSGAYWTSESAPIDACAVTDADGNYTLAGLRYGESTTFSVTPEKSNRVFEPGQKQITLSQENAVQNEVLFFDATSFAVQGQVVYPYEGVLCPADSMEVYLEDDNIGDFIFKTVTEADGQFLIAGDPGPRQVQIRKDGHTFTTATVNLDLDADVTGLLFENTTTRKLSGRVGGGCGLSIGQVRFRIFTADGCIDKEVITDDTYEVNLPPEQYFIEVLEVDPPDGSPKADIIKFFDQLGVLEVDLRSSAQVKDILYRAPLSIAIQNLPSPAGVCAGTALDVPLLTQGESYPINIKVFEDLGGGNLCPLDSGTVAIYDEISGREATPVELEVTNGEALYTIDAGKPNIFAGRIVDDIDRSYQNNLFVLAEAEGLDAASHTEWVFVEGVRPRVGTFVTMPSSPTPMFILHDPPGDNSYSYIEKGTSICKTYNYGFGQSLKVDVFNTIGGKQELIIAPLGGGIEIEATAGFTFHITTEAKFGQQFTQTVCMTTNERFSTSADPIHVGHHGDVFVGAGLNFLFALADQLTLTNQCTADLQTVLGTGIDPDNPIDTEYIYTRTHLEGSLLPELENLRTIISDENGTASADFLTVEGALTTWRQMITTDSLRQADNFALVKNRSFSAGTSYEYSKDWTDQDVDAYTFEQSLLFSGEGKVETPWFGFMLNVTAQFNFNQGYTKDETNRNAFGYVLADDDAGDYFSVDVGQAIQSTSEKPDPHGASPYTFDVPSYYPGGEMVFRLVSGRSSNPWEPGPGYNITKTIAENEALGVAPKTQPRDGAILTASPPTQVDVDPDGLARFTLGMANDSQTPELREYHLRTVHTSNPGGARITANGAPIHSGISFWIGAQQSQEVTLEVRRGPRKYNYEDLQVTMYPPGEYGIWGDGGVGNSGIVQRADTVSLDVRFKSVCSDINLLRPLENFVVNRSFLSGSGFDVILDDFDLGLVDELGVQSLGVEIRRQGTSAWTSAIVATPQMVRDAGFDNSYTTTWTYPTPWFFPDRDGTYELRGFTQCDAGRQYSGVITGTLDTTAPVAFGPPQPADGTLSIGDHVSMAFDEPIDCTSINADANDPNANVRLRYATGPLAGTAIPIKTVCDNRTLHIEPTDPWTTFENEVLEAEVRAFTDVGGQPEVDAAGTPLALMDVAGNPVEETEAWQFTIKRSAFAWTPANPLVSALPGQPTTFSADLVNGRTRSTKFTLVDLPDWITPSVYNGELVPGGTQAVNFTIDGSLAPGTHTETVTARTFLADDTALGDALLYLTVDVTCAAPQWTVNPADYAYSTTIVAEVDVDGTLSEDVRDVVAVYVGGEVRGVAPLQKVGDKYLAFITAYTNDDTGSEVASFQLWDAPCTRYHAAETVTLGVDAIHGTESAPFTLTAADGLVVQTVPMASGWTWFSYNADQPSIDLVDVLSGINATAGDVVKDRTAFSMFDGATWIGTLDELLPGQGYQIKVANPANLVLDGSATGLGSFALNAGGWTLVGYTPQYAAGVDEALDSLTPSEGDLVKSQTAFAQYVTNVGWIGSLTEMQPGQAYMIKSATGGTLVYPDIQPVTAPPTAAAVAALSRAWSATPTGNDETLPTGHGLDGDTADGAVPADTQPETLGPVLENQPDWQVGAAAFEHGQTVIAELTLHGERMVSEHARLAVFAGNDLRGVASLRAIGDGHRFRAFLTVYGHAEDVGTAYRFALYDPETDAVHDAAVTLPFEPDATVGTVAEPFAVHAGVTAASDLPTRFELASNYPNPFGQFEQATTISYALPHTADVKLEVYDVLGRVVRVVVDEKQKAGYYDVQFDARDLASGVYLYRLTAGDYKAADKMTIVK